MRFQYSTVDPLHDEVDSLPCVPLLLRVGGKQVHTSGLVDSGATVNVLPYDLGIQLGAEWDDRKAIMRLAGNLGSFPAMPLLVLAEVEHLPPVRLAFAGSRPMMPRSF